MRECTRRHALYTSAIVLLGSLAGCSQSSASEEATYERLDSTPVYVADGVQSSLPAEIETVDDPDDAGLLLFPDDTDLAATQAVEWLADGRVLALQGEGSEATWQSWARSDMFRQTFENRGQSDSEPDPSLVVGAKIGQYVTTYRWSGGYRVPTALDDVLVDISERTPPG